MTAQKKATPRIAKKVRKAKDGTTEAILLSGNSNFTNAKKVFDMAKNGKVDLVAVGTREDGYVRTFADSKISNNLSNLPSV